MVFRRKPLANEVCEHGHLPMRLQTGRGIIYTKHPVLGVEPLQRHLAILYSVEEFEDRAIQRCPQGQKFQLSRNILQLQRQRDSPVNPVERLIIPLARSGAGCQNEVEMKSLPS